MLISTDIAIVNGTKRADVKIRCPFCSRMSHVLFTGNKTVDAVTEYLSRGILQLTQELPFETPIREFLRSGYCRECMEDIFASSSKKIKYVRKERR